jgi:Putative peptidoglycan binding domain
VPERRKDTRRASASSTGVADAAAWLGSSLWARFVRRPVDSLAILGAVATSALIVVNAVFLQSHSRPAAFIPNPAAQVRTEDTHPSGGAVAATKPAELQLASSTGIPTASTASARRNDPIAELISSSVASPSVAAPSRLIAVQRILSEFGYGQIKPSGALDGPTSAAIEKFEAEHKLPVTGRLSDRLLGGLAAMIGHPIQ